MSKGESIELPKLEIKDIGIVENGSIVQHEQFGKGEVEGIVQMGELGHIMRINFENDGSKSIVPECETLKLCIKNNSTIFEKIKNFLK